MFDVTTARQIDYSDANGQLLQATVFKDRVEKGLWYLVPVPRLRVDNGQPVFSLTKYTSNGGGIAGACVFEVELVSPEDAKRAAQEQIPEITNWGQFTWVSGNTFFDFVWPVDGQPVGQQIAVTPSLFDTNVARFQVKLDTEEKLNSFVKAFSGEGGLSGFSIIYEMGVLTRLLGASATIKYVASAAIEYERKYETRKDTWGKSHSVLVKVKQILKQSGAGDVQVQRGAGGSEELVARVREWAWSTLETQVADAIESTRLLLAQGNDNPVSATNDFTATYSEDTIVEWSTPVSRFLPSFDADTWSKVYHEVDNRQLMVSFELVGDPTNADGGLKFVDVVVTVKYPTRTTDNTFTLSLKNRGPSSFTYVAPGGGSFDQNYEYKYQVNYPNGESFTSEWIKSSDTRISFRPNRLGIRKVSFMGSGVPFGGTSKFAVNKIFIDFFETPPVGEKPKLQTKEMTENDVAVIFTTAYHVPITNTYDYRLRYQLTSGDMISVQPNEQFGSANADQIFVRTPQEHLTSFALRALSTKTGDGFLAIDANAAYFDKQNPSQPTPSNYSWDGWVPEPQPGLAPSEPWSFKAQPDPQTAFFQLNGQVNYGDGTVFTLFNVNVPFSRGPLILKDTEEVYSVEIFTNQIDWTKVYRVTVNVFQLRDVDGRLTVDVKAPEERVAMIAARASGDPTTLAAASRDLIPYTILPPEDDVPVKSLPLFYTLNKLRSDPEVLFYFNADYVMNDGTVKGTGDMKVTNKLQIHLPAEASEPPGGVQALRVKVAAK